MKWLMARLLLHIITSQTISNSMKLLKTYPKLFKSFLRQYPDTNVLWFKRRGEITLFPWLEVHRLYHYKVMPINRCIGSCNKRKMEDNKFNPVRTIEYWSKDISSCVQLHRVLGGKKTLFSLKFWDLFNIFKHYIHWLHKWTFCDVNKSVRN